MSFRKRHLSKIKERRGETLRTGEVLDKGLGPETAAAGGDEPVIQVEKLVAKPMDPEEAAMQLSLSSQDFLVFRNSRSLEINVVYKRRDGDLGLIEPAS